MKTPIEIIRDLQSRHGMTRHIVQVTEQDIVDIQQEAYEAALMMFVKHGRDAIPSDARFSCRAAEEHKPSTEAT